MAYKVIMVHVEDSPCLDTCVEIGSKLALRESAHLTGFGVAAPQQSGQMSSGRSMVNAFDRFDQITSRFAVASSAHQLATGDPAIEISQHGLCCDLLILAKDGSVEHAARIDFLQYVILNCGGPVMVVPAQGHVQEQREVGEHILIAWNGGMAAARAVRSALPMLRHAREVQVAHFHSHSSSETMRQDSLSELLAYLVRHGIHAEVLDRDTEGRPGQEILHLASGLENDMIVMGCVAHPRYPGVRLGGATSEVLQSATIPVLMSH